MADKEKKVTKELKSGKLSDSDKPSDGEPKDD